MRFERYDYFFGKHRVTSLIKNDVLIFLKLIELSMRSFFISHLYNNIVFQKCQPVYEKKIKIFSDRVRLFDHVNKLVDHLEFLSSSYTISGKKIQTENGVNRS